MTNRIADHLPNDAHPLDRPDMQDRQRAVRVACLGVVLGTAVVVTSITMVVRFALGGRPIMQNGALVAGVPVVTVFGAAVTLGAVAVASLVIPALRRAGIKQIAADPPDPDADPEKLWLLYAKTKFAEYGLADGAAVLTAVLYHLSADWLMIVFVGGMLAFLLVRFPTKAAVRRWYAEAEEELDRERTNLQA
ncbi:MAG: hypothetical protein ABGY75_23390 [Gemmataceae bacterium]